MVYNTWRSKARSSFSGGIEGRPSREYMAWKSRESSRKAWFTICRKGLRGWSWGTRASGDR